VPMLPVILGLFFWLRVSAALRCYNCHSVPDKNMNCNDPFNEHDNTDRICDAELENMVCFKVKKQYAVGGTVLTTFVQDHFM